MGIASHDARLVRAEVHVLVPFTVEGGVLTSPEYDTPDFQSEIDSWFGPLGLEWAWQPVTVATVSEVVEAIVRRAAERPVVAFNLCDGFDSDGYPGPSLIDALDAAHVAYTGGGRAFYQTSSEKLTMKARFRAAHVPTAPWLEIADPTRDLPRLSSEVGYPAILKLSDSCAGHGLSRTSVVVDAREAAAQHARLVEAGLVSYRIFAERFLPGRECTVLVRDTPWTEEGLSTLPAVEMVYNSQVPVRERILFENHRHLDPDGQPRVDGGGTARCVYAAAPEDLRPQLAATAKAAYRAVGGNGYARVDLRYDMECGTIHALEVNTNPELSRVAPTVAPALAAAGLSFEALIADMLRAALARSVRARAAA
jgi:D-alanine-D-alanine ligase-like ATP-grasp enzyme